MADEKEKDEGKPELSDRQIDRRNVRVPDVDPEDIQAAHTGKRVKIVNVGTADYGGYDFDGVRISAQPGRAVIVSEARAAELLKSHRETPGHWEVFDPKRQNVYDRLAKEYAGAKTGEFRATTQEGAERS